MFYEICQCPPLPFRKFFFSDSGRDFLLRMINQFIVSEYLHDAVQRLEELGDVGGGEEDADLVDEVPLSGSKHGPSYGSLNLF